jgi:hypothetical protein
MTMKKTLAIATLILMSSCTNYQKQAIVEQDVPLASFSAQNQLDKTDNSMSWIDTQGIVEYRVHWGWKCSENNDKSFVWFEQKNFKPIIKNNQQALNVSKENCND